MPSMRYLFQVVGLIVLSCFFAGCDDTPEYVIKQDDMVNLLVDLHKGEGVVDINHGAYRNDSVKRVLKQSIYARHGVTSEQVDTSLVWYGHHLEKYIEIYDKVIERLEAQLKDADVLAAGEKLQVSIAGDSVNVWSDKEFYKFFDKSPSNYLKFSYKKDENWDKGDIYTWNMYLRNRRSSVLLTMVADYTDGTSDYAYRVFSQDGWVNMSLPVDTAKTARTIYGIISAEPQPGEVMYLDSISLVRSRFSNAQYFRNSVKTFTNGKKEKKETADSVAAGSSLNNASALAPHEKLAGLPTDSLSRREAQRRKISSRSR